MKIIQQNGGYTKEELAEFKYTIFGNVITQMKVIVTVALKLNVPLDTPDNTARAMRIAQVAAGGDSWSLQVADDIKVLWKDTGILRVYDMRDRKYHLNDSAAYFFDAVDRIMLPDYVATYQDVLRARVRTTGIHEALFQFDNMRIRMLDVGGQRSERRKWIHCFPERDSQLLTSRGFLCLADVLRVVDWRPDTSSSSSSAIVVTDWRGLTVATLCTKTGRLVYRTPNRLVVNGAGAPPQQLVEIASSDFARQSAFAAAGVSVVATDGHQLYARTAVDGRPAARSFRKLTCADVMRGKALADKTAALADAARREQLGAIDAVTFLTAADGGLAAPSATVQWLDAAFGARGAAQQAALLAAYGRWLATGGAGECDSPLFGSADRVADWALTRLDKAAARSVVAGWQQARAGPLFAATSELRDDLVRLLLHAGFTATFAIGCCDDDSTSSRVGWLVQFAEASAVDASVRVAGDTRHVARELNRGGEARGGRTWCFDMSSGAHVDDGFVVVRRVQRVSRQRFAELDAKLQQLAPLGGKERRVKTALLDREFSVASRSVRPDADDAVVVSASRPTIQGSTSGARGGCHEVANPVFSFSVGRLL
jgi:hypothetical protein